MIRIFKKRKPNPVAMNPEENQISSSESVGSEEAVVASISEAPVVHEKPLVCLFDVDDEISSALKENQYNCVDATLGKIIKVNNKVRGNGVPLPLYHEIPANLHEYDVVVVDMKDDEATDLSEIKQFYGNVVGRKRSFVYSEYPEQLCNQRPLVTSGIFKIEAQRLFEKDSILVIFASANVSLDYVILEESADHGNNTHSASGASMDFYGRFPNASDRTGRKIYEPSPSNRIAKAISPYKSGIYESIFDHPKVRKDGAWVDAENFLPLLVNERNEVVAFAHEIESSLVIVLPQVEQKKELLVELFRSILPELKPEVFPNQTEFSWLKNGDYVLPGEIDLGKKRIDIEEKYRADLEENDMQLQEVKNNYGFLHDLISETGERLVEAVICYLRWLGFSSVLEADDMAAGVLEEDIRIEDGGKLLIIEVKGIGGTSTDSECSQVSKIRMRRMRQRQAFDVHGLYVVNHQRYMPPKRRKNPPFTDHQISDAKQDERGLVTTYELYKAYFMIEDGLVEKEEIRSQLYGVGLINLSPPDIRSIGVPLEFLKGNQVIVVQLDNVHISVGDFLLAKKDEKYERVAVESIQLQGSPVDKAFSGEVGIMLSRKIKKKSEIFIFDK